MLVNPVSQRQDGLIKTQKQDRGALASIPGSARCFRSDLQKIIGINVGIS